VRIVDSHSMWIRKTIQLFLYAHLAAFKGMAAQKNLVLSQVNPEQRLSQLIELEQKGRYAEVTEPLAEFIRSNALNERESGRAQLLLGIAYHQQRAFAQAQSAYEKALHILSHSPEDAADHAAALDNLARLSLDTGHPDIALRMETDALKEYEALSDHADIARSCATLASLEINRGHHREGKQYLSRALQEAGLASSLDQDFYAAVWSAQGWFALLNKDTTTAISAYAHAIELWRAAHGEQHILTGWGYMLLGKSYAQAGQNEKALEQMRQGLNILNQTVGSSDPKYLAAQISYSQVLDQSGEHDEAVRVENSAQQALKRLSRDACADCTVSAFALH
jgi:tetratricopeptide (TPR) repeat protein